MMKHGETFDNPDVDTTAWHITCFKYGETSDDLIIDQLCNGTTTRFNLIMCWNWKGWSMGTRSTTWLSNNYNVQFDNVWELVKMKYGETFDDLVLDQHGNQPTTTFSLKMCGNWSGWSIGETFDDLVLDQHGNQPTTTFSLKMCGNW